MSEAQNTVIIDGWLIDADTGLEIEPVPPRQEFHINDDDSFEWYMGKRADLAVKIKQLEAKKEIVTANLDAMIKEKQSRLNRLDLRFGVEVEAYVKELLADSKKRSITCMYGKAGFRKINENYVVADQAKAVQWAKTYHPDAVKVTEEFQKSKVDIEKAKDAPNGVFEMKPGHDKFYLE